MVSKNFRQLVTMATRFWNFPKKIEEEYLLMSETCIEIIVFLKEIDSLFVQRYQPYTSEILPKIFSVKGLKCTVLLLYHGLYLLKLS